MNIEQIRARLQGLAKKGKKNDDIWKPTDKHVIRCLPYPHGDEPFIELGFHYELGKTQSLLCPKHNFGEDCAICEFAGKLRSWKDEDGNDKPESVRKADFEIFKKIAVKERWFVAMIDRDKLDVGPKFWSFGKTLYEKLLNMCLNDEMQEVAGTSGTDVLFGIDSAFDLTVDFKDKDNKDGKGNTKQFPLTDFSNKLKPSRLAKTKKEVDEILSKVKNIYDVYPRVSSEEAEKAFLEFVNSGASVTSDEGDGVEYKANTAEKPVEGGQSIDEAFKNL